VRLKEIISNFEDRKLRISSLLGLLKAISISVTRDDVKLWREQIMSGSSRADTEWIEQTDMDKFLQSLDDIGLKTIEQHIVPVIENAGLASQSVPPDARELSQARITNDAIKVVIDANMLERQVNKIDTLLSFLAELESQIRDEIRERSQRVIDEISADIGTMWASLHPAEPIENVRLYLPADDKAIDVALRFYGKDQDSPRLTLSEGYRNSLGLCIFLAMAKREAAKDRPVFLDDVVISLDRNHRGMVAQLIEKYFPDRQVILLTHDRGWYSELKQQLRGADWAFKTLMPYENPSVGIRWSSRTTTFDDARAHLDLRPDSAGNDVRKIMDVELALIAEKLQIRLPYLRGEKNDMRMAHDFLERIVADGKKCLQRDVGGEYACPQEALDELEMADRLLVSWANRASHSFDITKAEAVKLIATCESAIGAFDCSGCGKSVWFSDATNSEWVQCQCGQLRWRYGKS